jgi:hypothetical protein
MRAVRGFESCVNVRTFKNPPGRGSVKPEASRIGVSVLGVNLGLD